MSAVASPCRTAAARISSGSGLIDSTRRSAASASPACCETAARTRSVKNVTALIAATATTSAASSTSTSPDRQSLASRRPASRHGVLITAVAPFVAPLGIAVASTRYWRESKSGKRGGRRVCAATARRRPACASASTATTARRDPHFSARKPSCGTTICFAVCPTRRSRASRRSRPSAPTTKAA